MSSIRPSRDRRGLHVLPGLFTLLITLFITDRALYLLSPWLPADVVRRLSAHAQLRRVVVRPESQEWVFDDGIRYGKPVAQIGTFTVDELGYRNPTGTAKQAEAVDVLLLGDSFTWGTEEKTIADFLRDKLPGRVIYSSAVEGEGIPQWGLHFRRFVRETSHTPRMVILNYYSGNDISDTRFWHAIRQRSGSVRSSDYFAYLGGTQMEDSWVKRNLELLELRFLVVAIARRFSPGFTEPLRTFAILPDRYGPSTFYIRREPPPALLTPDIRNELAACVQAVRESGPDTRILLSYIPTSAALYGGQISNCETCSRDPAWQSDSSAILARWASELGVEYLDATPMLAREAATTVLWNIAHFNLRGYELYADALAKEIATH